MKRADLKFILTFLLGFLFFLFPIKYNGEWTVAFDIFIKFLRKKIPLILSYYSFTLIILGALLSLYFFFKKDGKSGSNYFKSSSLIILLRISGLIFSIFFIFKMGPSIFLEKRISHTIWDILTISVATIIPIGAIFINIFTNFGGLEFIGVLARPLMRPLFKIPGRGALDAITSWVGSYSVALYLTHNLFHSGKYNKREVFIIATAFSTVSIGFVGVVASTLKVLNYFPYIFIGYFLGTVITAFIIVRIPPTSRIKDEYITTPDPEPEVMPTLKEAYKVAVKKAEKSGSILKVSLKGFFDGILLAASIIGTIVAVGTLSLLIAYHTKVFDFLAIPFIPIYKILGMPNVKEVSIATIIEIAEMYLPSLICINTAIQTKLFIAILSTTQLIFFSSVGPMIIDMFGDVPIKFSHLLILFFERTLILIPFTYLYVKFLLLLF